MTTGITLMGFLSVCWTSVLDGNVDLSVMLTLVNTLFYLGKTNRNYIWNENNYNLCYYSFLANMDDTHRGVDALQGRCRV